MKKLLLILAIGFIVSCKKEKPVEPTPVVNSTPINNSSAVFYMYSLAWDMTVKVNGVEIDKTSMYPVGWVPNCSTVGWCVKYSDTIGTYNYEATIVKNGVPTVKNGTVKLLKHLCVAVKI